MKPILFKVTLIDTATVEQVFEPDEMYGRCGITQKEWKAMATEEQILAIDDAYKEWVLDTVGGGWSDDEDQVALLLVEETEEGEDNQKTKG